LFLCLISFLAIEFHSYHRAWAYLNGSRLIAEPQTVFLRPEDRRHNVLPVRVKIVNLTNHEIDIVAAGTTAGCHLNANFPIAIPPKEHREIEIVLDLYRIDPSETFDEVVTLLTDSPEVSCLRIDIKEKTELCSD